MDNILSLQHITASYGSKIVLQDISLVLPRHRIVGLVGESGSGKSTVARVVTGLLPPDSGEILFNGKPLGTDRPRETRRKIQMVFQNPEGSLNPKWTVGRSVADGIRFHGLGDKAQALQKTKELLSRMELPEGSEKRLPSSFSGGQKQRIALARALAVEPELLVADEPTSALDVSVQRTMLDLILKLKEEAALSVLFISHDLGVIRCICDHVIVMRQGQILESSSKEDFFREPRTEYGKQLLESVPQMEF